MTEELINNLIDIIKTAAVTYCIGFMVYGFIHLYQMLKSPQDDWLKQKANLETLLAWMIFAASVKALLL